MSPEVPPEAGQQRTVVHLVRHGEVHNPAAVLYGRLADYHLSATGRLMAERVAEYLDGRDVVHLRCSPLERAQETMEPIAERFGVDVDIDGRVIEAGNRLEGSQVSWQALLRSPAKMWLLRNPLRPSWGESYVAIVARMRDVMRDAAVAAAGHEAVVVSHQLPIWMARCDVEGRRLVHDPRKRQCGLASVTSFTYIDGRPAQVTYHEPAADLVVTRVKNFVPGA